MLPGVTHDNKNDHRVQEGLNACVFGALQLLQGCTSHQRLLT